MLPEWTEDLRVPDEEIGTAFESMPAQSRAWIKKTLAQLFACFDPYSAGTRVQERTWGQGFCSVSLVRPLDWTLIWVGTGCDSPVRTAAAAALPILAGVKRVVAGARFGEPSVSRGLLPALELAGVEDMLSCGPEAFVRLEAELSGDSGRGTLLAVEGTKEMRGRTRAGSLEAPRPARAAVWAGSPDMWDYQAIGAAHPGLDVTVWGPGRGSAPERWRSGQGEWESFLAAGGDVLYVPGQGVREALSRAPLVLTPGQEGCWVFPGLGPADFVRTHAAWSEG